MMNNPAQNRIGKYTQQSFFEKQIRTRKTDQESHKKQHEHRAQTETFLKLESE